MNNPLALLISGVDTVGSGRMPRLLSDAGYEVHLLGSDRLAASRSKHVSGRILSHPGPDAAAVAARDHLERERDRYARIVIADEPTLWAAIDNGDGNPGDWLQGWFPVPLTSGHLDRLRSKTIFLSDCRAAGIPTPAFEICETEPQLWRAAASIGFPVFIKAPRGWAGSGLMFARSRGDLEMQFGNAALDGTFLVQEEVTGEPGSLSVLYRNGEPVCWFAYLMIRTWPNRFAAACSIRLFPHPEAAKLVASVGRLTGFTGLAGIDFVWNRVTDRLMLLEFNPRPTPVYHLGPHAGVDFARSFGLLDRDDCPFQCPNQSDAIIDLFPQALYYAAERGQVFSFIRAMNDAPWTEPELTAAYFSRFLTHYIPVSLKQRLKRLLR